jgi:hypothetical protein
VVAVLLAAGADAAATSNEGRTPADMAKTQQLAQQLRGATGS